MFLGMKISEKNSNYYSCIILVKRMIQYYAKIYIFKIKFNKTSLEPHSKLETESIKTSFFIPILE